MRKSIWYNNNINFFVEYKLTNKKNKITLSNNNSLFTINKYFYLSNENNNIFLNFYKKFEFFYIYFIYYFFISKYIQHHYFLNKNIIHLLFNKAFFMHLFRFL
jgi:hypothetical protein